MSEPVKQNSEFRILNPGPPLTKTQEHYMRILQEENIKRATNLKLLKRRGNLIGLSLAGAVLGIYVYSIVAIKQEKFLDDFDEPAKVIDVQK